MTKEIQLRDKLVTFQGDELENVDLQEILKVHYERIEEEIADFPFILNQINFFIDRIWRYFKRR